MIIIAVRDPTTGAGDFGRQLVWGAVGWIIFFNDEIEQPCYILLALFTIAIVILLSPLNIPITPSEEWWNIKSKSQRFLSGSSIVKYLKKSWLILLATLVLGTLWGIIDSIEDTHMVHVPKDNEDDDGDGEIEDDDTRSNHPVWRTVLLIGDLLAIPTLVYSAKLIDHFGKSRILVAAFGTLVLRYFFLAILDYSYWDIVEDLLVPTTLGLTWVAIILFFKETFPRKAVATAQALPIIVHFCVGRFFGAVIGIVHDFDVLENEYEIIAILLIIFSFLSIIAYRWRDVICEFLGNYIPCLKPSEKDDLRDGKLNETDV